MWWWRHVQGMGFNFVSILHTLDDKSCSFDDLDKHTSLNALMFIEIGKNDILGNRTCGNK